MSLDVFFHLLVLLFSLYLLSRIIASLIKTSRNTASPPPPKAKGAWPIIGHLHTRLTHTTLGSMAHKYGPIFTVQLGAIPAVVVSSSKLAKELLTTHDLTVSSRPKLMVSEYFGYNYAMLGLSPYGSYWRDVRKVSTVHLLSNAKMEQMKDIRVFEVDESIRDLYMTWTRDGKRKIMVEMKQWLLDLTFNISIGMIAEKRGYGSSAKNMEVKRCQSALRVFFDTMGTAVVADYIPFLRWFDFDGHENSLKKSSRDLDSIVQGWLDEHRLLRKDQPSWEDRDFMDVLLTVLEGKRFGAFDSDTINKATCTNMIAGIHTTPISITWALCLLLNNRQALKKAQDELDIQVGRDRKLTESDIPNLPYLQAILKETLRLCPPYPLATPREFANDCILDGYRIAKGSRLTLNLHKIHRDPGFWPNPLEFQPERFLTTHKNIDVQGGHFELMPFGGGRRMCPAVPMAMCLMQLVLGRLLHAFEFSTSCDDAPVDMEEGFGLMMTKANPLNVLLTPRLPPHLYL